MPDPSRYADSTSATDDDGREAPGDHSRTGRPRWVNVSLLIVIAVVVLVVILMRAGVFGGEGHGQFGPGQHAPEGG
ncbi:MAG: hypothetical protein ACREMZ_17455 [Gemmatimonadales bacterium]